MSTLRHIIPTLLLGSIAVSFATRAAAADRTIAYGDDNRPSRTISIEDLDLNEASDVQRLHARLQRAAVAVCESEVRSAKRLRQRVPSGWQAQCTQTALDDVVRKVGNEQLTALHRAAPALVARQK